MIRPAAADDIDALVNLVRDLAEYEEAVQQVELDAERLRAALFSPAPALFAHVADIDGEVVGMAIWFLNYSTWTGRHGLYLEDLFVRPEARGRGLGKQLLATLARVAIENGYGRFEWSVLDWNRPAVGFYQSLGAVAMDEWTVYRIDGDALANLAGEAH